MSKIRECRRQKLYLVLQKNQVFKIATNQSLNLKSRCFHSGAYFFIGEIVKFLLIARSAKAFYDYFNLR